MELVDKSLKEGERRGPDVKKNKALKLALTRTNFKFGEEVCMCADCTSERANAERAELSLLLPVLCKLECVLTVCVSSAFVMRRW
jgi:hypothetical protein